MKNLRNLGLAGILIGSLAFGGCVITSVKIMPMNANTKKLSVMQRINLCSDLEKDVLEAGKDILGRNLSDIKLSIVEEQSEKELEYTTDNVSQYSNKKRKGSFSLSVIPCTKPETWITKQQISFVYFNENNSCVVALIDKYLSHSRPDIDIELKRYVGEEEILRVYLDGGDDYSPNEQFKRFPIGYGDTTKEFLKEVNTNELKPFLKLFDDIMKKYAKK